ncbi:arginase family protein [Nonomuraea sp. NPDC051191]|uniref:arginase family protein n=1 Tax=Nonomuraea sp. NPDC051191 TaxID=3364372 RepID=UPI0037A8F5DD
MSVLYVPYHLDEHQPDLNVPLPGGVPVAEFAVELPGADVWSRLGRLYDAVATTVERAVRAGERPVVVSGDCTVSIGMTAGLQRAGLDPSIVWIDAHGDLQTPETTTSGYLGGMALRFLLGYRPRDVAGRLALRPPPEDRVLLVDARDLDPPEAGYLASSGVTRAGLDEVTSESLPPGPLLLNLDLDVLDPSCLPGLRYPAAGGPDVPALLRAVRVVLGSGRLAALNLACTWHPGRDDPGGVRERLVAAILADLRDSAG